MHFYTIWRILQQKYIWLLWIAKYNFGWKWSLEENPHRANLELVAWNLVQTRSSPLEITEPFLVPAAISQHPQRENCFPSVPLDFLVTWVLCISSYCCTVMWHVRGASLWETGHDVGWQFSPLTENFLARHALLWLKSTTKIQPLSKYHPNFSFLNSSYFCSFFKYRSQSCRRGGTACWYIPW